MRKALIAAFSVTGVFIAAIAGADGHASEEQLKAAVKARQAHMTLYSFHLGTLGGMAKGEIDYDAASAQAAADSLAALATMSQAGYWLPGSDSDSIEGSRALPAIWAADSEAMAKGQAMADAALAMQAVAGTDLAALQGAMGDLGGACGGCHKPYRQSNN